MLNPRWLARQLVTLVVSLKSTLPLSTSIVFKRSQMTCCCRILGPVSDYFCCRCANSFWWSINSAVSRVLLCKKIEIIFHINRKSFRGYCLSINLFNHFLEFMLPKLVALHYACSFSSYTFFFLMFVFSYLHCLNLFAVSM